MAYHTCIKFEVSSLRRARGGGGRERRLTIFASVRSNSGENEEVFVSRTAGFTFRYLGVYRTRYKGSNFFIDNNLEEHRQREGEDEKENEERGGEKERSGLFIQIWRAAELSPTMLTMNENIAFSYLSSADIPERDK